MKKGMLVLLLGTLINLMCWTGASAQMVVTVDTTGIDTFDYNTRVNPFYITIDPDSGWHIDSITYLISATGNRLYNGFVIANGLYNASYVGDGTAFGATVPCQSGIIDIDVKVGYCPQFASIGVDTVNMSLQIYQDSGGVHSIVHDTVAVSMRSQFYVIPSVVYDTLTGLLTLELGDWVNNDTTPKMQLLISLFSSYLVWDFSTDTVLDIWHIMDSLSITDTCMSVQGVAWWQSQPISCFFAGWSFCRPLAVSTIDALAKISIFPSPTKGMVTVNNLTSDATITLINHFGKVVWSSQGTSPCQIIDFSGQPEGLYFVTVETSSERITRKVIKE